MKPHEDERARFSLALTVVGATLAVAGILLMRARGEAAIVGLVLLVFGLGGVLQAVVVRIGLVPMPGAKRKHEDRE